MNPINLKKNQELEVEIIDLSHEGLGVAKVDTYPLFIENALPGEIIQAKIMKVGTKFGYARVVERIQTSPDRQEVINENLLRTGIAPLSHLSYEQQLLFKQTQVEKVMTKIAKMPEVEVLPTLRMENPIQYRNKAQIPVRKKEGELVTGFYRKNSHQIIPVEDFYIQDPAIDAAIIKVRDILSRFGITAYNEEMNEGFMRHIVVRRGHYSHQMMIVLVTRRAKFFKGREIAAVIKEQIPEVVSVIQNVNEEKTNVILGPTENVLYGQAYIEDQLLGKTYRISAKSFYQVNTVQTENLYKKAFEFAALKPTDTVIDAYAGIGTIGLSIADQVKHVYGMEIVAEAVSDANENAKLNGIENATYLVGKAEKMMAQWQKVGIEPDVVFVDPPRKGLDASFIEATCDMQPEKVVYISCNPATMARDLVLFKERGYEAKVVQPVDLFPQTHHVECVALVTRVGK
ncbi:MAG: 23S rRNA (uracil(1939)-C(5))-methyltransferase RlmD [Enterococcus lemanii]|jgi:23S rRNA (uracil1939-C5)-methyltransferase